MRPVHTLIVSLAAKIKQQASANNTASIRPTGFDRIFRVIIIISPFVKFHYTDFAYRILSLFMQINYM